MFLETFDLHVRCVAEIAAEAGLSNELSVEALMAYCVSLPEADDLILGFLRGDLTLFSLEDQTRQIVERDTRYLELDEVAAPVPSTPGQIRLGKALALRNKSGAGARAPSKVAELEAFIRDNPAVLRQVQASSHEFLVRWVMLYVMQATRARERSHRLAHEFWKRLPMLRQNIESVTVALAGPLIPRQSRGIGP